MEQPLVSIICLCTDHEKYVASAIESALGQSYEPVELIVVDDASSDNSLPIVQDLAGKHRFQVLANERRMGNCRSFNQAFRISKGDYVIDLAADDLLLPGRVAAGVEALEQAGAAYGVHFCDVELLDEEGNSLGTHYKRDPAGKLIEEVPSGDIYRELVERYVINAPSMMMLRKVLEELNGYDEDLSYEDYDFWVRSSRNYKYAFTDEVLVQKRILKKSLSSLQYQYKNIHTLSTARVCHKAARLNKSEEEDEALLKRIRYELKWALITENWEAAKILIDLQDQLGHASLRAGLEKLAFKVKPPWYRWWKMLIR